MRTDTGQVFRLEDYRPSDYLIPETDLLFDLSPERTRVRARLTVERRDGVGRDTPLVLDGDGLKLVSLSVDGETIGENGFTATPDGLSIIALPATRRFTVTIETEIDPSANTTLMGLYRSSGVYCTQCEAEGFRRITYFLDRPDVLSTYSVRIEADRASAPLLLSNGNPGKAGDLANGRHFAEWHDPHPKPSYLFALVAGDLGKVEDRFVTASGREVELAIYVEHGKEERAAWAMDCLKRSMKWDEEVFGREYDLDVFNIVAVSDFNMGAMENKGLNVFNDKYVLADFDTATDADFANIEAIIAHEYFHNWTGNRITCRDWFQLCLKEGLTVFRDHEFSADMRSRPVKRIAEIRALKAHQFPEDQGPLAHPVRPRRYREINNFYTATVYEKGSEVVRMIRTILGPDLFRSGMDLYFERHDGEAATVENFLKCFEDAAGRDLSQFALWYHQAGTPNVTVSTSHDPAGKVFTVELEQSSPATPGESRKRLLHIPLAFGLVGPDGCDMEAEAVDGAIVENGVINLRKRNHTIRFHGIAERPVLSVNRGFSAPVTISCERPAEESMFLARHDADLVSRWDALTSLATEALITASRNARAGKPVAFDPEFVALYGELGADEGIEQAWRALALTAPGEGDIAREIGKEVDPDAIHVARESLIEAVAIRNREAFGALYHSLASDAPYRPDAAGSGRRALRNVLLDYLSASSPDARLAREHYAGATNMTDRAAALTVLVNRHGDSSETESALADFEARWGGDPLVMDKWFAIQACAPRAASVEAVRRLSSHPRYQADNPNRVRALFGAFATANQIGFHRADGEGYRLFTSVVLAVEKRNPQLAARLATAFRSWRSLETVRREQARKALLSISEQRDLSADLRDIVDRTLA
ncbi:MAG: aminopeptidase N [Rhizobiaceae bacterium]|nr:aminopeptidase N [Rhizobiaceae bacterium]MCV0405441.1 aminopeptidase N [Rhizobiaceae bacterium]